MILRNINTLLLYSLFFIGFKRLIFAKFFLLLDDDYVERQIIDIFRNVTVSNNVTIESQAQTNALYALYNATDGENWKWREDSGKIWNFTAEPVNPCDNWQGVECEVIAPNIGTIVSLQLTDYGLVGTIPDVFMNLSSLVNVDLNVNILNGTIPPSLGKLENLTALDLSHNYLHGGFPRDFFKSVYKLEFLTIAYNELSGQLPEFGELNNFLYFNAYNNLLIGRIPKSIKNLKRLNRLYLGHNLLTGSLENITSLVNLERVSFNYNLFSQAFPKDFGNLINLQYLYVQENYITGTIPESFAMNCTKLMYLTAYLNELTGPLPTAQNWKGLQNFIIDDNFLTGKLPDYFDEWTVLRQFIIYTNFFSGTLPASLSKLPFLQVVLVEDNSFHGNPMKAFNASAQLSLQTVDISLNLFSGQLPESIFGPSLVSFTSFKTCFTATIPKEICSSLNLQILDLDGLSSNCAEKIWPDIKGSPKYAQLVNSKIPDCIWSLPNITQIRMSANGLTGTIPSLLSYGNLTNLDLSFNSLTGSIPYNLQSWYKLLSFDLQNNKLTGDISGTEYLDYSYSKNQQGINLKLSNNRLSGIVPLAILHAENINIVQGNLFSCSNPHPPPYSDPNGADYVCASNLLDISLYGFIGLGGIVTIFVFCFLYAFRFIYLTKNNYLSGLELTSTSPAKATTKSLPTTYTSANTTTGYLSIKLLDIFYIMRNTRGLQALLIYCFDLHHSLLSSYASASYLRRLHLSYQCMILNCKIFFIKLLIWRSKVIHVIEINDPDKKKELQNLIQFLKSLRSLRRITIFVMLCYVIILVPLYEALKSYYRTYETQYRWYISGAFLSGYQPAIAILLLWMISLTLILFLLQLNIPVELNNGENNVKEHDDDPVETLLDHLSMHSPDSSMNLYDEDTSSSLGINSEDIENKSSIHHPNNNNNNNNDAMAMMNSKDTTRTNSSKRFFFSSIFSFSSPSTDPQSNGLINNSKDTSIKSSPASDATTSSSSRIAKRSMKARRTIARMTVQVINKVQTRKMWINIFALMINGLIVILFKTACIYLLVVSKTTFNEKLLIEVALSSVDILWGSILLPMMISNLPENKSTSRMLLKTIMLFFNSIVAPLLIIAVADSSCFNGIFWAEPTQNETFTFTSCLEYSTVDKSYCQLGTSWQSTLDFTPTWVYNYNCYSTVLISYIPIFLLSYITLALFIPAMSGYLLTRKTRWWILDYFPGVYYIDTHNSSYLLPQQQHLKQSQASISPSKAHQQNNVSGQSTLPLTEASSSNSMQVGEDNFDGKLRSDSVRSKISMVPGMTAVVDENSQQDTKALLPAQSISHSHSISHSISVSKQHENQIPFQQGAIMTSLDSVDSVNIDKLLHPAAHSHHHHADQLPADDNKVKRVILFPAFILASAMHHLLVLITFGLMCPALAVAIALVTTTTTLTWEILIGRWMIRDQKVLGGHFDERFVGPYTLKLDELCETVCCSPRKCVPLLCFGSGIFYGLTLLDMAGDQQGWFNALWAPATTIFIALVLYITFRKDREWVSRIRDYLALHSIYIGSRGDTLNEKPILSTDNCVASVDLAHSSVDTDGTKNPIHHHRANRSISSSAVSSPVSSSAVSSELEDTEFDFGSSRHTSVELTPRTSTRANSRPSIKYNN